MQASYGQVEFVPLPPRFAGRVRWGSVVVGVSLLAGMLVLFALTAFVNRVVHGHAFPDTLLGKIATILPPLCVAVTAILVLTCRRCLRGDYLVVATARATRNALLTCFLVTLAITFVAFAVPTVFPVWADAPLDRTPDLLGGFAALAFATVGFLAGIFYVRPSLATLRKFSDHPIW